MCIQTRRGLGISAKRSALGVAHGGDALISIRATTVVVERLSNRMPASADVGPAMRGICLGASLKGFVMLDSKVTKTLLDWAEHPARTTFPYSTTLGEVRKRGKHFMGQPVLQALDRARQCARQCAAAKSRDCGADGFLEKFLDVVLDKYDGKYDYLTYTALPLLEHARPAAAAEGSVRSLRHIHDVLVCSIIGDALRFELNRTAGDHTYLPELQPDTRLVERRMNFALLSIAPCLQRLGFDDMSEEVALCTRVERTIQFCSAQQLAHSPFVLDVSMMPVYVSHDEHLFIRILQAVDTTFATICGLLEHALQAFREELSRAPEFILAATGILQEGLKHFQTLSTMQKESFSAFREFTTGASAIQSVNYKRMESLCRSPDKDRLESLAYSSVPVLQKILREGGESLDDKYAQLSQQGGTDSVLMQSIEAAMLGLAEILTRWRHSHFGIAKKYLGEGGEGTGYTAGTSYLKDIKSLPVFNLSSPKRN
jgi:tryptophan 2,3-dioxygenase